MLRILPRLSLQKLQMNKVFGSPSRINSRKFRLLLSYGIQEFQEVSKLFCPAPSTGLILVKLCKVFPEAVNITFKLFSLRKTSLDPLFPASVTGG